MIRPLCSFIIPAFNRENSIDRCIGSIANSGMITDKGSYEIIVIDDASVDKTVEHVEKWQKKLPYNLVLLKFEDHQERVIAMNAGFRAAQGEWVIRLDSDDELASHFKKAFEDALALHPGAKMFNWGSLLHIRDRDGRYYRSEIRRPFDTPYDENGMLEPFRSGQVFNGGFIFKKELLWRGTWLPETSNCYSFGEAMQRRYPEVIPLYTLPDGRVKTDLGNPWGDDWALYYSLAHHTRPVMLDEILHIQHVRT